MIGDRWEERSKILGFCPSEVLDLVPVCNDLTIARNDVREYTGLAVFE